VCRAISALATQHELLEAAGACREVVKALTKHYKAEPVARWGCRAVYQLSEDSNNRNKIGLAGGCEAVTTALAKHAGGDLMATVLQWGTGSEAVAEWGCAAIHKLAAQHPEHPQKLAVSGACEVVVRALQKHFMNDAAALSACRAIVTLSREIPAAKEIMGNIGACSTLVKVLQQHIGNNSVIEWACLSIDILSAVHDENTIRLGILYTIYIIYII
jgi:hypothetical protein